MAIVAFPYQKFFDVRRDRSLFRAQIHIGLVDTDPTQDANKIDVFFVQEDGTRIVVPQPIRTNDAGIPVFNGQIVQLETDGRYSMTVLDRLGVPQIQIPNSAEFASTGGGSGVGVVPQIAARQTADGTTTDFVSPASADTSPNSLFVNIDGIKQRPVTDYTVTADGSVRFNEAPPFGAEIDIIWFEPRNVGLPDLVFSSISQMKAQINNNGETIAFSSYPENSRVSWIGYRSRIDGGGNFGVLRFGPHTEDGGRIFSIDSETYIEANHPDSSLKWGVVANENLVISEAVNNRQQLERMLRYAGISKFFINNEGVVHVLGSIHPVRSDIKIVHEKGCHIKGYLDDPSMPALLSAGHIFGFALYTDPDNRDFTTTGTVENVAYELEGAIESVQRTVHSSLHNNNCLGFVNAVNCTVIGNGGIEGSDHRGVNFDADCSQCEVDIGYARQTSNECVIMRGPTAQRANWNRVRIRRVYDVLFDGAQANRRIVEIRNTNRASVEVNSCISDKTINPNLCHAQNVGVFTIDVGSVRDLAQVVRFLDSDNVHVKGVEISNVDAIVARAGTAYTRMRNVVIEGLQCFGTLPTIYRDDRGALRTTDFALLKIVENDFSNVTGNITIWDVPLSAAGPSVYALEDNIVPDSGWSSPQLFNELSNVSPVTVQPATFTYDIAGTRGDYPYTRLEGRIVQGANSYPFEFDLTLIARTSFNQYISVFHENGTRMFITTSKAAGSQNVTFTLNSAGTGSVFGEVIATN